MFFTRIGKVFAHLIFWLGLFRVAMGFFVVFGSADMESSRALASNIFGGKTTGQAIDQGFIAVVLAVALGVLCEISAKRNKPDEQA
jgi:hypothetical protein